MLFSNYRVREKSGHSERVPLTPCFGLIVAFEKRSKRRRMMRGPTTGGERKKEKRKKEGERQREGEKLKKASFQ